MQTTTDKVLKFIIGEETYPTILNSEEQDVTPFATVLKASFAGIERLLSHTTSDDANDTSWESKTPNNIIAFLGDRGTGKTSCMRSLVKKCEETRDDLLILNEIDPSFFDTHHNILDIVVGNLYGCFKDDFKEWDNIPRMEQSKLSKIQALFRDVKSAMRYLEKELKLEDEFEIDELRHLNEGSRLRLLLKNLISTYLDYKKKTFLIINIDDLDLNISCSYEMMECIRKYLILPRVAVIIAAKYNQLFDNICLVIKRHYKDIPHLVSNKEIAEMAERYLNKLLPPDQRFEMPDLNSYLDFRLVIEDPKKPSDSEGDKLTVATRVPSMIFAKTRYLFYNSSGIPSLVIPRNLRDLRMLTTLLWNMQDFEESSKTVNQENQRQFKNYFFQEWLGIIDPEYRSFAKHLLEEENLAKVNRYVISNLYDLFLKQTESLEKIESELSAFKQQNKNNSYVREKELLHDILNPSNSYWNVSIGDVVVIMDFIKKRSDSSKTLRLLFLIESYYSIMLYETYNRMTDMTDNSGLSLPEENPTSEPELKTAVRSDIPEYFRLIGGSFLSSSGDFYIPLSQNGKERREVKLINGRILLSEIRDIVTQYKKLAVHKDDFDGDNIPSGLSAKLRLIEFFMLTVKERVDLKVADSNGRLANEPLYFKPFGNTVKNLLFDATVPLVNAIYPKFAYDRFHADIFNIAKKDNESLLNRMIRYSSGVKKHELKDKKNDSWKLMSKAAIRNMEVLEDLTEWLRDKKNSIRTSGNGMIGALTDFYDQLEITEKDGEIPTKGYWIKTYNKYTAYKSLKEKNKFYLIDYSIYSLLRNVLSQLEEKNFAEPRERELAKRRNYLFHSIMSENAIFAYKKRYTKEEIQETLYQYISPAYVNSAITTHKDNFSDFDLADILASLTIHYRYDFSGRLPEGLQFYYPNALDSLYQSELKTIANQRESLEGNITEINEQVSSLREDIKELKNNTSLLNNDILNIKASIIKSDTAISIDKKNIEALRDKLNKEGLNIAEFNVINRSIEKGTISLHSNEGAVEEGRRKLALYQDDMDKYISSLKEKELQVRSLLTSSRKHLRELKSLEEEEKRIKYNFENRILIEP